MGEVAGTLSRALEQDEEKLNLRICGFLGFGLNEAALLSFVCQEETNRQEITSRRSQEN